jgi:hypothetical protein
MELKIKKGYVAIYSVGLVKFFGNLVHGKGENSRAATLFPFLIFRDKTQELPWVVNHEKIHFKQQVELLFLGLEILKFIEFIYFKFFLKKNKFDRYLYSACEQESYLNQQDFSYLAHRKPYAIFKYIFNKKDFYLDPNKPGEIIFK